MSLVLFSIFYLFFFKRERERGHWRRLGTTVISPLCFRLIDSYENKVSETFRQRDVAYDSRLRLVESEREKTKTHYSQKKNKRRKQEYDTSWHGRSIVAFLQRRGASLSLPLALYR